MPKRWPEPEQDVEGEQASNPRVYAQLWQRVSAEHIAQLGPAVRQPVRPPAPPPERWYGPEPPAPPPPRRSPRPADPVAVEQHHHHDPNPSGEYILNFPFPGRDRRRRTGTLLDATTVTIAAVIAVVGVALTATILAGHLLTARQMFFMMHSAFGILIVHAFGGGLSTLCTTKQSRLKERIRKLSTVTMAVVAWLVCITGTFFGYAGYRAKPASPHASLSLYPQQYLLSQPHLAFWDKFGMEWKIHVGWVTPFLATAVAFVALRYGKRVMADAQVRKMLTNVFIIAFAAAVIASVLGAVVNVVAPNDFMHRPYHF